MENANTQPEHDWTVQLDDLTNLSVKAARFQTDPDGFTYFLGAGQHQPHAAIRTASIVHIYRRDLRTG